MSVDAVFQLNDGTYFFTLRVNHGESFRDFTYLHFLYHLSYILRDKRCQLLHFEARCTVLRVGQQTVVITGIFILRKPCSSIIEREFSLTDIIADRVKTSQSSVNVFLVYFRTKQDVTVVYTVASFFYQLCYMVSEFCFEYF